MIEKFNFNGSSGGSFTIMPDNPEYDVSPLFKNKNMFNPDKIKTVIAIIIKLLFLTILKIFI